MVNDVKHQTKSETRKLERFEQMQLEYFSTRDADVEQTPTPEMHYTVYRNDGGAGTTHAALHLYDMATFRCFLAADASHHHRAAITVCTQWPQPAD